MTPSLARSPKAGAANRRPEARRRRDLVKTRAALLDAASEVFARRGLDGATLEEIAETAGFTRGAVHHHFTSKEELFLAVIARHDERLLAGYGADVLSMLPPDTTVNTARWRELHADDRREVALRLELRSHALRSETLRSQLVEVEQAAVAATADRLSADGQRAGVRWRYPVEEVAQVFHLMSQAVLERAAITGEDCTQLMEMVLNLVWNGSVEGPGTGGEDVQTL